MSYAHECSVALAAVQQASLLTRRVFREKVKGTLIKDDKSPVTFADYGAQAIINHALQKSFPQDEIMGEEESSGLRDNPTVKAQLCELIDLTPDEILDAIDAGKGEGGRTGRVWTLDPVDGTAGFLRGGQYAICLALLVDGDVKVGVLGCPNLPFDSSPMAVGDGANQTDEGKGVFFSAVKGQGAFSCVHGGPLTPISMRDVDDITQAIFCESVDAGHSNHDSAQEIGKKLGITQQSVRMDSQAKYGSIARGAGDIYLRLPTSKTYQEKIWDHAAGDLIVREAGGMVTDTLGRRLDFGHGRTLKENKGIVATRKELHPTVLAVVKEVLKIS